MEKAKRIDRVDNSLTKAELRRRLPEVDLIENEEVRNSTIRTFLDGVPDYFWNRAASSSGNHHPPDERGKYGTWIHTKRVFVEYVNLSESYLALGRISDYERQCGMSAALLHDTLNYGWPSERRDHTTSEHDVIAAAITNYVGDCPEEVVHLVHAHMGNWGEGKLPETENERLFHLADKSAAKKTGMPKVYEPTEEMENKWKTVDPIRDDDWPEL